MNKISIAVLTLVLTACTSSGQGELSSGSSFIAPDVNLTVVQNSSVSQDLISDGADGVTITQNPSHGSVRVSGTQVTYRATDPLYNGADEFKYTLARGLETSEEGTAAVTVTALASGTTTHTEHYTGSAFDLTGWQTYTSTFGHTGSSATSFSTATHNAVLMPSRKFQVYGDILSYAGDPAYTTAFSTLPVDGTGGPMMDWPWKAEMVHIPQCGADAEIIVKLTGNLGQYPMLGILLNYDIQNAGTSSQSLTGYQVLLNTGGGSLTLSRFNGANELATAFLDRWPSSVALEGGVNPVTSGPYKGWNYKNGGWASGGNAATTTSAIVAIRYQYNNITDETTISYEPRPASGADGSPGVYDQVVTLSGADSLPTGGSFGLMAMNYHVSGYLQTTDFDVVEFKLTCTIP